MPHIIYCKNFKNIDNSNLKAVASLQEKKRALFKDKFELELKNIFSNYDELITQFRYCLYWV